MVDKRLIEKVINEQRDELEYKRSMYFCQRQEEALIDLNSMQAQVVIGVRRSGKSTLCFQALEHASVAYGYVNFDDERLFMLEMEQLNDVLEVLYKVYGNIKYLFLDEVQDLEGWHLFVNRLLRQGMHVVITGSNAKLLSSELATHLSGRSKEIYLYPFSFSEYCAMKGVDMLSCSTRAEGLRRAAFDEYLQQGGFPELLQIADHRSYVGNLTENILHRDIEHRYRLSYKAAFEQMANHLLNISPCIISINDLVEQFKIKSEHTIRNYIDYLKQTFLLIGVKKYSAKSRLRMTQEKVYAVDVALMNERENAFSGENLGWRLETIVLSQLLRECRLNRWDIYYMSERSAECDFLLCKGNEVVRAIQVSYDISNPKTRKREINGLILAANMTGCENLFILTDHEQGDIVVDNHSIHIVPVYNYSC